MDYKIIHALNMNQAMIKIYQELGPNALIYRTRKAIGGIEVLAGLPIRNDKAKMNYYQVSDHYPQPESNSNDVHIQDKIDQLNRKIEDLVKSVSRVSKYKSFYHKLKKQIFNVGRVLKRIVKSDEKTFSQGYASAKNKIINIGRILSLHGLRGDYQVTTPNHEALGKRKIKALIGPSGVGKTTTLIKLAMQFSTKYEFEDLGVISTNIDDIYLKSKLWNFCGTYNVDHIQVSTVDELNMAIDNMANKKMILIDTHGVAQRDIISINKQRTLFANSHNPIDVYLVFSASHQPEVIEDCIKCYRFKRIKGSILTKVDEALQLEPVLSVLSKCAVPVSYVCNGEDFDGDIYTLGIQSQVKRDGLENIIDFGVREFANQSISWI